MKNQVFLGRDAFVKRTSRMIDEDEDLRDIPASQRWSIPKPLQYYGDNMADRNTGIISAYKSGGYSMKAIGEYYGLSYSMVSRILKKSRFKTWHVLLVLILDAYICNNSPQSVPLMTNLVNSKN